LIPKAGKQIELEEKRKRQEPEGKKKVPIIFIEADGCFKSSEAMVSFGQGFWNGQGQTLKDVIWNPGLVRLQESVI